MTRKLAFVSGAPRTSTKVMASLTGGRQHMLGTISGFEANSWQVASWIVGDKVPESWLHAEHEMNSGKSFIKLLAADTIRICLSIPHILLALRKISSPDWVYERYAAYQLFGYFFQRRGSQWILETNAPLYDQAASDLKHVALPALLRWAERFAYQKCDILVVISEDLKRMIVDQMRISAQKIIVLPNAADTDMFDPDRTVPRRLFSDDTFIIGFQGAMYKWAGLEDLIRAVASLRGDGLVVSAVLLGDGHERKRLELLATELGIGKFVQFVGRVRREVVPEHIAGFDLCFSGQVNFSGSDSMYHSPLKLYDYMSMGKPVIASRFADAINLTRDGRLGYLYEPGNLNELIRVATLAYYDRGKLREMAKVLRAEILTNHTWSHRIRDLIIAAEAILATKRSKAISASASIVTD